MPSRLKRFHHSGQTHFITFCCYRRRKLFLSDASKETFELALERVRRNFQLCVYGYVVMPEHVHLLLSEPDQETLAVAIRAEVQLGHVPEIGYVGVFLGENACRTGRFALQ